jgi:hypothetical protein
MAMQQRPPPSPRSLPAPTGLASQAMAPKQAPEEEPATPTDFETTPTKEEQKAFDKASTAAMRALNEDEETHNAILQTLQKGASQPAKTIAQIATSVFSKIDKDSGGKMPTTIMFGLVEDIADQVIEVAEESGAIPPLDETVKGQIAQELVQSFSQLYDIPKEELQALISSYPEQEVQQMVQQQQQIAGGGNGQLQ